MKNFGKNLVATVLAFTCMIPLSVGTSHATLYFDQASWLAAVAGLSLAPYSGGSVVANNFETATLPNQVIGSSTTTSSLPGPPNGITADFSWFPNPGPDVFTGLVSLDVTLNTSIIAFDGTASASSDVGGIFFNGEDLLSHSPVYNGFFGFVGPIPYLELSGVPFTDDVENITVSNLEFFQAVVPEPNSVAILGTALLGLVPAVFLRRRNSPKNKLDVRM
jgi:hypothetical protein